MKRIRIRKAALPILVVAMACAVGVYLFFFAERYYSDPAVPYSPPVYIKAQDIPRDRIWQVDLRKSVAITWQRPQSVPPATKPLLTITGPPQPYPPVIEKPSDQIRFRVDKIGAFREMTFRVEAIGLRDFSDDIDSPVDRMTWYGPDLAPLSTEEVTKMEWIRNLGGTDVGGSFPKYCISLRVTGKEKFEVLSSRFVDPRNQTSIGGGFAESAHGSQILVWVNFLPWRPLPVQLVVDLGYGPVLHTNVPPTSGTLFQLGPLKGMLAAVVSGASTGYSMSLSGSRPVYQIRELARPESKTSVAIVTTDGSSMRRLTLEGVDRRGTIRSTDGSISSGNLRLCSLPIPIQDIQSFRISARSKTLRLVIDLPALPGLPPENATVSNLFDLHLPVVKNNRPYLIQTLIARTTGFQVLPPAYRPGRGNILPGPPVFHNTTPRELLERLKAYYGPGVKYVVDKDKREIRFVGPGQTPVRRPGIVSRILMFFRRLFS